MKAHQPPKTLRLLIEKKWLVETITGLGSGYLTHLSYQNEVIDPEVLQIIKNKQFEDKVLGEIIFRDQKDYLRIAEAEVIEVNDFQSFIRFDLRLLEVVPFIRGKVQNYNSNYLCYLHIKQI